jgi:protein involved in ribonucleotide reduction
MLHIIYFSNVSENTHRFINRLTKEAEQNQTPVTTQRLPLKGAQPETTEDYILIAPSYGTDRNGHVPPQVKKFLSNPNNRKHCVGVIGAGNINFGDEYAAAADAISHKLQIPILYKFELSGFHKDTNMVLRLAQLDQHTINQISEKNRKANAA